MNKLFFNIAVLSIVAIFCPGSPDRAVHAATCAPTEEDVLGPFYKPSAPLSSSVGKGYNLRGVVRSSSDCAPVPGAVIELWLTGPERGYDDAHRATVFADLAGEYHFESDPPPPVEGRPPHIHLRVSANGFATLVVTQHYPLSGRNSAVFDSVLVPSR